MRQNGMFALSAPGSLEEVLAIIGLDQIPKTRSLKPIAFDSSATAVRAYFGAVRWRSQRRIMMASGFGNLAKLLTLLAGIGLLLAVVTSPFAIARGGSKFGDIAQTPFFQASFVITMIATFVLTLAFASLAAQYGHAVGGIGMLGFFAAMLGASLLFAAAWAIVTIVPAVARVAPTASIRALVTLSALLSIGPLLPLGLLVMALTMIWISRREEVAGSLPGGN